MESLGWLTSGILVYVTAPGVESMRVFVGEYVCGGGLLQNAPLAIPTSLRTEGEAMLQAIVSDISFFADAVIPIDPRLGLDIAAQTVEIEPATAPWAQWAAAAKQCDSALIVAPESDGTLAKGVAMLRAAGVDVIASSGDFLRVASDKLQTAKALHDASVAHPLFMSLSDRRFESDLQGCDSFVVKPRDGCGTQEIRTFDSFAEARDELREELILQQWRPGRAVSVSLIASGNHHTYLPAVAQILRQSTCQYDGGCGPLPDDDQRRATSLASRAIAAMPPTPRGFVGLDLLLADRPSEDCVIEINPRLTTSYVGLRRMIKGNLAARLFEIETGPVHCATAVDGVRWTPDGQVWVNDVVADGV
ncbi:ATP-grasp domain-containing protein [Planctomycetes bacterium K23_9]|uniref:Carbamoyl phosphate synthase-like protein n=1 Tax=Stieleria marina TaxID=1930275 RepID=A0A517NQP1_9BACT|nr:carbamoyl phosphate synthase-like protein [Planctomycetes bacterium K23_9]